MRRSFAFLSIVTSLLLGGVLAAPVIALDDQGLVRKKDKEAGGKDAAKDGEPDKPGEKKEDSKEKSFKDVIKDFALQEGLFKIYRKDDKTYLELRPDQYDVFFMASVTRLNGVGEGDLLGNQMLDNYLIQFHKVGKSVQLLMKNVMFRADTDPAMKHAVDRGFSDSMAASAAIASLPHHDRKSDLIDLSPFFVRDVERVVQYTDTVLKSPYGIDKDNSYLGAIKTFPRNVEIESVIHFVNPKSTVFNLLPDSRSMLLHYNYSITALPEGEYRPRLADDRVGHFVTTVQDFSTDSGPTPAVRYVNRWKLEKADPAAPLSAPKTPITYYLDNSIPPKYRKAVTDGILVWNRAFEKIGFKDAVVVKQAPEDSNWDSADARYATVRWFITTDSIFAIGPSQANPFTGQIYDADIGFSESMTRYGRHEFRELVEPLAAANGMIASARDFDPRSLDAGAGGFGAAAGSGRSLLRNPALSCTIGSEAHRQAAFGFGLLEARGMMPPGGIEPGGIGEDAYVNDFLTAITAHEFGHTIGLRHNFRASLLHPVSELQDAAKTTDTGLTGSVMEYTPVNLAPAGQGQGQFWQTTLGPYDYWAVEYAYKPIQASSPDDELPELKRIASRAAEPALAYATDEDAAGFVAAPVGMDPRNHQWDIGSDPIAYYTERVKLARELWSSLPGKVERSGDGYQVVRRAFNSGAGEYFPAVTSLTKYVGGVMHNRDHVGDPGGRAPYAPVAAVDQRRALGFLSTYVFAREAFQFKPELVNALAAERFGPFSGFVLTPRLDYPVHDLVLAIQKLALTRLYHPLLLTRVLDVDTKVAKGQDHVEMAEIFATLRDNIWKELPTSAPPAEARPARIEIDSFRRALQRAHLDQLVRLATGAVATAPDEAAALARIDLLELRGRISVASRARGLDASTKSHLIESQSRIEQALDAKILRGA